MNISKNTTKVILVISILLQLFFLFNLKISEKYETQYLPNVSEDYRVKKDQEINTQKTIAKLMIVISTIGALIFLKK